MNKKQTKEFLLTHWPAVLFLLHYGAGSLFTGCPGSEVIIQMIEADLEDGKSLGGPGDWGYEVANMVEKQDLKKIFETIQQIIPQLQMSGQ